MSVTQSPISTAGVTIGSRGRFIAFLKRIAIIATGSTAVFYINQNFDYVAYPYMAIVADSWMHTYLGTLAPTLVVMTIASIIVSLAVIWLHDWTGRDWLGLEELKAFTEEALTVQFPTLPRPMSWRTIAYVVFFPIVVLKYLIKWIWVHLTRTKFGNAFVFIGFAFYDPVYSTIYMRDSKNKNGWFTRRDWLIFLGSIAVGNGLWAPIVSGVAPGAWEYLSTTISGMFV